jgi:hypothetical protein
MIDKVLARRVLAQKCWAVQNSTGDRAALTG